MFLNCEKKLEHMEKFPAGRGELANRKAQSENQIVNLLAVTTKSSLKSRSFASESAFKTINPSVNKKKTIKPFYGVQNHSR